MKNSIIYFAVALFALAACNNTTSTEKTTAKMEADTLVAKPGYAEVNGLKMYYEVYGEGRPLLLIHGGGSTIDITFGRVIPLLAKNRQVIAVEMQAHGRTGDRKQDLSFEQDADDIAGLLKELKIAKADIFGFSNGGTTALQLAIRYPELVGKVIAGSALLKRDGVPPQFWGFMRNASLNNMPPALKEAYKKVVPGESGLQLMHDRDAKRMVNFKDVPEDLIKTIKVPVLFINGDKDVILPAHALAMQKLITNSEVAILPGTHGQYIGEITTLGQGYKNSDAALVLINNFLNE